MEVCVNEMIAVKEGLTHMSDKKRSFIERSMLDILSGPGHLEEGDIAIRNSLTNSQMEVYNILLDIASAAYLESINIGG